MITLKQIKEDIESGKTTMIYYSAHTLWWTHLDSDLKEAMEQGHKASDEKHERMMKDPKMPAEEKERMKSLYKMVKGGAVTTPLDPSGSPLLQISDLNTWIANSEAKPEHFGKHGIDAFVKSHHQNCEGECYPSWEACNTAIDNA